MMNAEQRVSAQEQLKTMGAQQRIEFFRGLIPDYSTRVSAVVDKKLSIADNVPAKVRDRILHAFQMRVEDHLSGSGYGGGPLDHLSQIGVQLVTENQQRDLDAAAAALAGEIMHDTGFDEQATQAYAAFGRLVAKDHLSAKLQDS